MAALSPQVIIAIVCIAAVIVLILVFLLSWCACGTCDRCGRWSRRKAIARDEVVNERELAASRLEFDEIRQQHDTLRDQIRVKYNLNGDNSNVVVVP